MREEVNKNVYFTYGNIREAKRDDVIIIGGWQNVMMSRRNFEWNNNGRAVCLFILITGGKRKYLLPSIYWLHSRSKTKHKHISHAHIYLSSVSTRWTNIRDIWSPAFTSSLLRLSTSTASNSKRKRRRARSRCSQLEQSVIIRNNVFILVKRQGIEAMIACCAGRCKSPKKHLCRRKRPLKRTFPVKRTVDLDR